MKKVIGLVFAVVLIFGIGTTVAAGMAAPPAPTTYVAEVNVQGVDGIYRSIGEVVDLVDEQTGAIQLRAVTELAPWLSLSWDPGTRSATIENTCSDRGIIVSASGVITFWKFPEELAKASVECTVSNINGRLYLLKPDLWRQLGIEVSEWCRIEYVDGGNRIHLTIYVPNPSAPPPTPGGLG